MSNVVLIMGVKGLDGYIESNSEFLKNDRFRQNKLLIDGSCLFFHLYFESDLDRTHGGDYYYFEETVALFFQNLSQCKIQPYVLLDGSGDVTGTKFSRVKQRCEQSIRNAHDLVTDSSKKILPILIKNVFKQVLERLGIKFNQCLAEADKEAAALANKWNCPVLSSDSDFYIFSNQGGFLPIKHFQWRKVDHQNSDEQFIPVKCFDFKEFCTKLNVKANLLPLFAIIQGNDYTTLDRRTFPNFSELSAIPEKNGEIDGLFKWLSRFSEPSEAIDVLKCDRKAMNKGMEVYSLEPSYLAQFFDTGETQISNLPQPLDELPDWTLEPLVKGKLNSSIIAILTQQKVTLKFQVENFKLTRSSKISQHIRQMMYGILLCRRNRWHVARKQKRSAANNQKKYVEEYDREMTKLTSSNVLAVLPTCLETNELDEFESVWELPRTLRLQVMSEALKVSLVADLSNVPTTLQLAVYVTRFWLKHAIPKPKAELFWALLVCLVYGHLRLSFKRINKILTRTPNLEFAHAYSQWLYCLHDSFNLNQLLNHPVPEPELARLYCGSFVHSVAHELENGSDLKTFVHVPDAIMLYTTLQDAVEHNLDDED